MLLANRVLKILQACTVSFINIKLEFNIHGPVHRNNILMHIHKDATLHTLLCMEIAIHVSGGTITHHQERKQFYLQHLIFVTPLSWKSWNRFECAVGSVYQPQHTQTGSNSSTIATDSSNGATNTRCRRYSCLRS